MPNLDQREKNKIKQNKNNHVLFMALCLGRECGSVVWCFCDYNYNTIFYIVIPVHFPSTLLHPPYVIWSCVICVCVCMLLSVPPLRLQIKRRIKKRIKGEYNKKKRNIVSSTRYMRRTFLIVVIYVFFFFLPYCSFPCSPTQSKQKFKKGNKLVCLL